MPEQLKFYEPPENDGKPEFLIDRSILTSQVIGLNMIGQQFEGKILGYTLSDLKNDKRFITLYVENNQYGIKGYISRTYKFHPEINTKGEFFRLIKKFNINNIDQFTELNNKVIKYVTYYSTGRGGNTDYQKNQDGNIYVNFKTIFDNTSQEQTNIENTPAPTGNNTNDYKTCNRCNQKVSNYIEHLESDCKKFIVS